METQQNNTVNQININNLKGARVWLENFNPHVEDNRLNRHVFFTDYWDLMTSIEGFIEIIESLSSNEESCQNHLDGINSLCKVIKQLLPKQDIQFLDDLFIKEPHTDASDFVNIDNIGK